MALLATDTINVRPGGSDTNGGIYGGGGTDYSLQDNPILARSDLTAAGTTTVTSVTGGFTAALIGNGLNIASGLTAGVYRIVTVPDANTLTLDRSPGTSSVGVGNIGGAFATPGKAASIQVTSQRVNIMAGTYPFTSNTANVAGGKISSATSGTDAAPVIWSGYSVTPGDGAPTGRPTIQATATSTNPTVFNITGNFVLVENLILDANSRANSQGFGGGGTGNRISNCKALGADSGGIKVTTSWVIESCEVTACTAVGFGFGFDVGGAGSRVWGCVAHDNTTDGFRTNADVTFSKCVSANNTGTTKNGFLSTGRALFQACTSYGNTGDGFRVASACTYINCVSYGNTGIGFGTNAAGLLTAELTNCAGGANTGTNYDATKITRVVNFVTLTANPFTNAGGLDFSTNTTAGGGAALRSAGAPATFPGAAGASVQDIGAYGHADPAGGGGGNWIGAL